MNDDYFSFENQDYDIPFYRDNPRLSRSKLALLILGLVVSIITVYIMPVNQHYIIKAVIITLATLLPITYALKGYLKTIFRLPRLRDIITIFLGLIGYVILSALVSIVLNAFSIPSLQDNAISSDIGISMLSIIIQILGEELEKFIVIILVMLCAFRYIDRKKSVILAIAVSQIFFAMMHIPAYGFNVAYLLLSLGVAFSILPVIYLKTKNITVAYLTHLLIDVTALFITIYAGGLL